ncbi:MAG TPA: hypothetical protein VK203_27600 [Nostocaceae cyanobacterium]|nr:hypothetical protein [Nostocaceae cyanobacterium]
MKKVLLFACTGIATFFLLPAIYFALTGQVVLGIVLTCLGLLFLPQLFELTKQYGLFKNLIVRILAFFLIPIIFAPVVKLSGENAIKPSYSPTPRPLVSQKPTSTSTPTPTLIPTLTPTPVITEEAIIPRKLGEPEEPYELDEEPGGVAPTPIPEFTPTPTQTFVGTQRVRESVVGSC